MNYKNIMSENNTKIIFCGDTFLKTKTINDDPFFYIRKEFLLSSIVFLNLETVISEAVITSDKTIKHVNLITSPDRITAINSLGERDTVRIVNLANNHILDFGPKGLKETIRHLQDNNIEYIGLANKASCLITVNDKRILFVSGYNRYKIFEKYSDMVASEHDVAREIKKSRDKVDIIIVSMHWGTEHVLFANPIQQKLARRFIELGADLIVGHHPHCIQGHETYHGKNIYYSIGNFNFWHLGKETLMKNRRSLTLEASVSEKNKISIKTKSILINTNFQPIFDNATSTTDKLEDISKYNNSRINTLLFYRIVAKEYLKGNLASRISIIKKKPIAIINTLLWILFKPFNLYCYLALVLNILLGDKSTLNDWD